jgi:hypothetical protein
MAADQFDNAAALADAAVARVCGPDAVDVDAITDALGAVLTGGFDPAATALAVEFAAMPDADATVAALGFG